MNSTLLDRRPRMLRLVMVTALVASMGAWLVPIRAAGAAPGSLTWSAVSPPAAPPPLANATMAYDSDNATVVLFGGQRSDGTLSSDTWVWNGSTWTSMTSPVPARQLASMAFDPALHQLILFGGQGTGGQLLNDTWAWNGATWYQQAHDSATTPPAREGAPMAFDANDQLVLFGGTSPAGSATATGAVHPTSQPTAGATAAAPTTTSAPTSLADTWVWTGSVWSQQSVTGPPARSGAALAWDPLRHQTVLFGGSSAPAGANPPAALLGDTWVADDDLGGLIAFGGGSATGPAGDTWLWNGQAWTLLAPTASPTPRQGAAAAYDSAAHQLVLFGGITGGGTVSGDTEILTINAPTQPGGSTTVVPSGTRDTPSPATGPPLTNGTSEASGRPAGGSGPPASTATVPPSRSNSEPRQVHPGGLVTLTGSGFRPGTQITITFHSAPYLVGLTTANAAGDFSATVAVPTAASPGLHHFDAVGMSQSGTMISLSTPVQVIVAALHHRIVTKTVVLVLVATALPLGTWLIMALSSRRRRLSLEP